MSLFEMLRRGMFESRPLNAPEPVLDPPRSPGLSRLPTTPVTQVDSSLWRVGAQAGGRGGRRFDHLHGVTGFDADSCRISAIEVWHGDFIDSIHVTYTGLTSSFPGYIAFGGRPRGGTGSRNEAVLSMDGPGGAARSSQERTLHAGGRGGRPLLVVLSPSEVLKAVFGVVSRRHYVYQIGFRLLCTETGSERDVLAGTNSSGRQFLVEASPGFCIAGFHGKHGDLIDRIGVYLTLMPGLLTSADVTTLPEYMLPRAFLRDARVYLLARNAAQRDNLDLGRIGEMEDQLVLRNLCKMHLQSPSVRASGFENETGIRVDRLEDGR